MFASKSGFIDISKLEIELLLQNGSLLFNPTHTRNPSSFATFLTKEGLKR